MHVHINTAGDQNNEEGDPVGTIKGDIRKAAQGVGSFPVSVCDSITDQKSSWYCVQVDDGM